MAKKIVVTGNSNGTAAEVKHAQDEAASKPRVMVDAVVYEPVKVNNANLVELKIALDDALKRVCPLYLLNWLLLLTKHVGIKDLVTTGSLHAEPSTY